jgi:phospholipid/cholesterol/gamma-HCH transport system substrate-binding protein
VVSKYVRNQLVVFALLTLLAVLAIVFPFTDVPGRLGYGKMELTAVFSDGAGIYKNSNVTFRGAQIGRVTDVRLTPGGVAVDMSIDGNEKIATNSKAEIHSVSAVGEQFVDFVPPQNSGPYLKTGDVVPLAQTSIPQQIAPVLDKVDTLLASVPQQGLQTFLDEGYKAFQGVGPDLGTLVDSSIQLVDEADRNYPQTEQLIRDVGPLLDTQNNTSASVRSYFADLAGFTDAVRHTEPKFRHMLPEVRSAAHEVNDLFKDNEVTLPFLTTNLKTVARVVGLYRPAVEQLLAILPNQIAWEQFFARDPAGVVVGFDTNVANACSTGYNSQNRRSPNELTDMPAEADTYCKVPQNDPRVVRGVRNIPCLEGHVGRRAATIEQCRDDKGYQPLSGSKGKTLVAGTPPLPQLSAEQNPLMAPNSAKDPMTMFGAISSPAPNGGGKQSWQSLMTTPAGL